MKSIPTFSISDFDTDKETFVKKLGDGYREFGFAAITDHGIPKHLIDSAFEVINQFFTLDEATKMKYHQDGIGGARGYTPFGVEVAKDSDHPDLKEFWHVGREVDALTAEQSLLFENIWPEEIKDFKEHTLNLYNALDQLGNKILSALAQYLGLNDNYFVDKTHVGNSILRPIHYPPVKSSGKSVRSGQHEDINLITLLVGSQQPGLEILTRDNEWIPVTSIEGAIVVNIGDMLQRLTNNYLPSTTHRVVNPEGSWSEKPRYSIPYFLHFNSDVLIKTLDSCIDDKHPNLYPQPITADDYLKERLIEIGLLKN